MCFTTQLLAKRPEDFSHGFGVKFLKVFKNRQPLGLGHSTPIGFAPSLPRVV
ncbi:MAG TPA: hypothetical protein QGG93_10860 [Verrucomicrobiota bacterium]|nr:hypothetical protein [Verrucomicrobiota bacterium]